MDGKWRCWCPVCLASPWPRCSLCSPLCVEQPLLWHKAQPNKSCRACYPGLRSSQGFAFEDKPQQLQVDAWGGCCNFHFLKKYVFSHTKMAKYSGTLLMEKCMPRLYFRLVSCSAGNCIPHVQLVLNFTCRCFLSAGQLLGNACKNGR